jgi:tetratricopeptide (TPR) repeat protein
VADALAASLTGLATRMLAEGDRTGALAALEQAVEVDPRNIQARKMMAEAFRRQGEYLRALEQADRGLEIDPDNAWLLGTRGQILEALGEDDRAEADLRRTVQLDGKLAWARTELGDLLRVKRRYAEAIAHLSAAIEASPSDPWPLASKGAAEYALDHYDEALRLLTAALDLTEGYAWAHAVKAAVLGDVDELADAMSHSERGLHLDPSMGWAWTHLGWILLLLATDGSHDLAVVHRSIDAHREGVERQRRALPALAGLGEALTVAGQTDEGAALFVEAIGSAEASQVKLDADGMATLGWCHLRLGQHEQAIDALAQAMSLDTTHVGASFDLALALLCANRTDVALDEYMQALARVRSVRHQGRRRSLLRAARTSLQLAAPPDLPGRAEVTELLIEGGDHGADRASHLQMPYA